MQVFPALTCWATSVPSRSAGLRGRDVHATHSSLGPHELYHLLLGPALGLGQVGAARAVALGEESAVAAVRGLDESDIGIGGELGARFVAEADERIVRRVQDERGDGDVFEDARGAGAGVVIVGAGEAGVGRGDLVVEAAHAPYAGELREIVAAGEGFRFAAHRLPQVPDEVPFIETIAS